MMKPFPWGVFWRKTSVLGCCLFPPPFVWSPSPVPIHLAVENQVQVRERIHKMVQKTEQRGFTATLAQMETWAASRGRIFSPPPAVGGKAMSIRDVRLLIVGWSPWYNAATLQGYPWYIHRGIVICAVQRWLFILREFAGVDKRMVKARYDRDLFWKGGLCSPLHLA